MQRRQFLLRTAALAALPAVSPGATSAAAPLIDTNVSLGHWPTRRSWVESTAQLVAKLRSHGVTTAWTSSFDAALHTDVAGLNSRLAEDCARAGGGLLVPFGAINPTFPDWEEDLRRCHEVHRMPGVRLLPGYHGYALDDTRFARLLALAAERRLLVQIALTMEDDRSQNPVFTAAPVNAAPLPRSSKKIPPPASCCSTPRRAPGCQQRPAQTPLRRRRAGRDRHLGRRRRNRRAAQNACPRFRSASAPTRLISISNRPS
jgi:hypothetical protein